MIIKEKVTTTVLGFCLLFCLLIAACAPSGEVRSSGGTSGDSGRDRDEAAAWSKVPEVLNATNEMREVMKAKVADREVVAVLQWRAFNGRRDALQATWYGDMGSPPPTYVVESLLISMDGRGLMVPMAQTRYLCSQWMNDTARLGLYLKGENLCIYVTVGDGSDAWVASYIINPDTGAMLSHSVERASAFRKRVKLR